MSGTRGVIGLDIGSVAIKFVAMDSGGRVRSSGLIPRLAHGGEISREEAIRIRSVLTRRGLEGTRVAVGAPPTMATGAVLELPPRSSGAPIDDLARAEIARIMRAEAGSVETVSWEVPRVGRGGAGTTVMGVGCHTERATELVEALGEAGLTVESIEPECVAIARAAGAFCGARTGVTVDLGASSGRVGVVVSGHVAMERDLGELGVLDRVASAASGAGLSDGAMRRVILESGADASGSGWRGVIDGLASEIAEDAVRAIKESVAYVHGKASAMERVCVCGWGGEIPGVVERIGAAVGVETSILRPAGVSGEPVGATHGLAAGLALAFVVSPGRRASKGGNQA